MRSIDFRIAGLFLFVVLSCGLGWPASKVGLAYMTPAWYTASRLLLASAIMFALVLMIKKFSFPKKNDVPLILVIGVLQISGYMLLANIGLSYLPSGRSSLLGYTTPLWVMPLTILFFNEKSGWLKWLGFILGTSGLTILISPWELDWSDKNTLLGAGMLLLASLGWAISMLCVRHMKWEKSPLELIPWQLLVGALPMVILACITEPNAHANWQPALVLSLIYTGILVTGLSYWSSVIINKALPTITVSLGFLLVPVVSLLVSAFFMGETVTLPTLSAMGLILLGVGLTVI